MDFILKSLSLVIAIVFDWIFVAFHYLFMFLQPQKLISAKYKNSVGRAESFFL